jgi:hypothetical protein
MNEVEGAIAGLLLFVGVEFLALVILMLSAVFARKSGSLLFWGMIAVLLMVGEYVILSWAAGVGSSTSGDQTAYSVLAWAVLVFAASLGIYTIVAFWKCRE